MPSTAQDRALAGFAVYLRVEKGLAPLTVSSYGGDLKLWAEFLAGRDKTVFTAQREDLKDLVQHMLGHGMDSRSVARKLSALRHFYRYLLMDKLIAHDPTLDIDSPKQWKVLPKALSEEEVAALVESPGHSDALSTRSHFTQALVLRDSAMLEVLYAAAMRVSELVDVRVEDTKLELGYMLVRGKGDKERIVPLGAPAQQALRSYIQNARPLLAGIVGPTSREGGRLLFRLVRGTGNRTAHERLYLESRDVSFGDRPASSEGQNTDAVHELATVRAILPALFVEGGQSHKRDGDPAAYARRSPVQEEHDGEYREDDSHGDAVG